MRIVIAAPAVALILASACGGSESPAYEVGEVAIPATLVEGLSDQDRELYFDLIAFGSAVSAGDLETLGEPIVSRRAEASRVALLPYFAAAAGRGWGESDLRAVYDTSSEYELRVRHIVRLVDEGASAAEAEAAQTIATEVHARAVAGEDFGALAAEFSEEPGAAERGGALQPGRRGSWVEPFWAAAERLGPGEVSPVIRSEYGFHVIRLEERSTVPFEAANRSDLLRRVIPPAEASDAMEGWVAQHGVVLVDPPAAIELRSSFLTGRAPSDTLIVAHGSGGEAYRGPDAIGGWALLADERRRSLTVNSGAEFVAWVEEDAREVLWARFAEGVGAELPEGSLERSQMLWDFRAATMARAFGFTEAMSDDRLRAAALDALRSGAAEARSARPEVRGLRPLLRGAYPVTPPAR